MQPPPRTQPSAVVNWSIRGQLIDQFYTAVVVVNGPPFKGAIDHPPRSAASFPPPVPPATQTSPAAVIGYAVAERAEPITDQKRHRLTTAKPRVLTTGGADVLHF
jgi:hypothetical protein